MEKDDKSPHLYSNRFEDSSDSEFIYEKRATLRATLSIIKQTNHLIMGKNFIKFLHVLSHVCTILHVLS